MSTAPPAATSTSADVTTTPAQVLPTSPEVDPLLTNNTTTLADLTRHHRMRAAALKERNEAAYKSMCSSATAASAALVEQTNRDAFAIFNAEQHIESQIKQLTVQTEQFQRKLHQWGLLFSRFDVALKEMGDLNNWSAMIEQDVQDTVTILDEVSKKKRQAMGLEPPQ